MALDDLIDGAAAESDDGEDVNPEAKESSPPGSPEGSGDDLADSSEEEEGSQNDAYDYEDKFLARDEESDEEAGSDDAETAKRKRKRRRRDSLVLEEEDYDLLEENQVTGIRRPRKAERKRIRKQTDADDEAAPAGTQRTAAERLREDLFGRDEPEGLEDELEDAEPAPVAARQEEVEYADDDEDLDEFADFIDDDVGDAGGGRAAAPRRRIRRTGLPAGVSNAALREAQDIFGDVSGLLEAYANRPRARAGQQEGEEAEEELDDEAFGEDTEAAAAHREEREAKVKARAAARAKAQVEPTLMEAHHMLPQDETLRQTDIPERLQLAAGRPLEDFDTAAAAEWIYKQVWGPNASVERIEQVVVDRGILEVDGPPLDGRPEWDDGELYGNIRHLNGQRGLRRGRNRDERRIWRRNRAAQTALQSAVEQVVRMLWLEHKEVPLIAGYYKAAVGELLAVQREDMPGTTSESEEHARQSDGRYEFPEGTVQAKHRRVRRWDGLWGVYHASLRYRALQRRRETRAKAYRAALEPASPPESDLIQEALQSLLAAQSLEGIADADTKFQLANSVAAAELAALRVNDSGGSQVPGQAGRAAARRPKGVSAIAAGKAAGLAPLVAAFGITPAQLGENLDDNYQKNLPEDSRVPPLEAAGEYTTEAKGFDSPEEVLARARGMAATFIAAEPAVRAFVRARLGKRATLSTEPTTAGEAALDAFHQYGRVARLRGKPVDLLQDTDHFLRAVLAEREGLLTLKLELPGREAEQLLKDIGEFYLSDAVSDVAKEWNSEREKALAEAVHTGIVPGLLIELRGRLLNEAREVVSRTAADRLWSLASVAPLKVRASSAGEEEEVAERRVMACVWGPGGEHEPATTLVMLNPQGGLVDLLMCSTLSGRIRRPPKSGQAREVGPDEFYTIFRDPVKGKDAERIKSFMIEHTPHVVAVGASGLEARQLKADLDTIRDAILEHNARVMTGMETGNIDVQYVEENVAAAWSDCAAAKEELGDQPTSVRRAVALGRTLLEPLPVIASLCGPDKEVLSLNLHPLQSALPQDDLLRIADTTMITLANQVGADINAMATTSWLASPLPYIAGLGPRKARALLQAVMRATSVDSRHAIWRELGVLGATVFHNAGPFLRVRASGVDMANTHVEILDDTRVQPAHYRFAMQMAGSATRNDISAIEEGEGNRMVEDAMSRPDDVEALDLVQYAQHLEHGEHRPDMSALLDMRMELLAPFAELRLEREPLREEEIFWLLVGGDREALREGRLVEARVRGVTRGAAFCTLPDLHGLDAVISADSMSSSGTVDDCRHRVKVGDVVKARILRLNPERYEVELTSASDALRDDDSIWERKYCATGDFDKTDPYYVVPDKVALAQAEREARKQASKKTFTPRPIRHPLFRNLSVLDAVEELRAKQDDGDCLFRPSPKGTHMLHVTMRMRDGPAGASYFSTDIREGAKGGGGMGAHLKLGKPLTIEVYGLPEPLKFDDLDEVGANYVEPVYELFRKVVEHPKFRDGPWTADDSGITAVQDDLRAQKARSGGNAVYAFGVRYDLPGIMYLGHILRETPYREMFTITPKGYYFRKRVHKTLDSLVNAFKKNPISQADRDSAAASRDMSAAAAPPPASRLAPGAIPEAYRVDAAAAAAAAAAGSGALPPPPQQQQQPPYSNGYAAPAAGGSQSQWGQQPQAAWEAYAQQRQLPPPPPSAAADARTFEQQYYAGVQYGGQQAPPPPAQQQQQFTEQQQALAAAYQQQWAQQQQQAPPPPPQTYAGR